MTHDSQSPAISQKLMAARQDIATLLRQTGEMIHIQQAADPMDRLQDAAEREVAIVSLAGRARTLHQIDLALLRVRTGGFGLCQECEELIGAKRLAAVPWAPLCLKCQETADRQDRHESTSFDAFASAA